MQAIYPKNECKLLILDKIDNFSMYFVQIELNFHLLMDIFFMF